MCSATRWLTKGASIGLALCLFLPNPTALAEESVWQKAIPEGKQLREQGRYAEAEQVHVLAVAEAEKFGPEDRRLALSLNELAALYHATGRLREAEPLYRRALAIWERLPEPLRSPPL
jgi:tetratricopeptide (TPR) repeat protein